MTRSEPSEFPAALAGALVLTSLCEDCLVARTRLSCEALRRYLTRIIAAHLARGRRGIGPVLAYCQRCQQRQLVYRLR